MMDKLGLKWNSLLNEGAGLPLWKRQFDVATLSLA